MPKAPEFLHFGASRVPEPKPISTLSSRETRPPVLSNGLLFSMAWPGSLRMRDAVNTQGSGPNRPALLLRPISEGMTDLLIPEPQVDTGDFPPPRPRVWSPLGWAGTAPSHLRRGMQSPSQTISSRTELKPSIGPDDSWVYSWLRRYRSLRIVCSTCLYKRSNSSVCEDLKVHSAILC